MLKALNLSHKFDYLLFNDINLDIKSATTTAIMGVSGSGKSTILHILSTKYLKQILFFQIYLIFSLK